MVLFNVGQTLRVLSLTKSFQVIFIQPKLKHMTIHDICILFI